MNGEDISFKQLDDLYNECLAGGDEPDVLYGLVPSVILERIEIPKGQVALLVRRKPGETLSQWADRCGVLYNVGPSPQATDAE